jgi:DNA-binding transcriptional MocR family regulator
MLSAPAPVRRRRARGSAGANGRRKTQATSKPEAAQRIYEHIVRAVEEHRLPPGTKLGEETLADLFGVSRARVRQALHHLSLRHIVTLHPNRGAFVAEPSIKEARAVFAARRLVEPPLAGLLVGRPRQRNCSDETARRGASRTHRPRPPRGHRRRVSSTCRWPSRWNSVVTDIVRGLVARSSPPSCPTSAVTVDRAR